MKKTIGTLAILTLGVGLALVPTSARAACAGAVSFGQVSGGHPQCSVGGYCYVTSSGLRTNASIQGNFWVMGNGNTTVGVGIDNGSQGNLDWIPDLGFGGGVALNGNWQAGPAGSPDGCPDTLGGFSSMALGLTDIDASTGIATFAAACVARNGGAATEYDYNTIVPLSNIDLKPIAKPTITASTRVGDNSLVTVASPNFANIFYTDGSPLCTLAAVIPRYDVWVREVARDAAAPVDRNTPSGWVLGNTCNVGGPCQVTVDCAATNCDAFLAVSPRFDSQFGTLRVGANSTRTQAGAILATPPKPKAIKKVAAPDHR
jgi:hypothetical protein